MKQDVSALLDGELEEMNSASVFAALRKEDSLRKCSEEYRLIGDALRREPMLDRDISARVMDAIRNEPVVLAPRPKKGSLPHALTTLAATVSGVAIVAWVAFVPQSPTSSLPAEKMVISRLPAIQRAVPVVSSRDMRDYLVAHQSRPGAVMSVFSEPLAGRAEMPETGFSRVGHVNVYRRIAGDRLLVVLGEVPPAALQKLGDEIDPHK
jgi:negative regulator of sigma E activity